MRRSRITPRGVFWNRWLDVKLLLKCKRVSNLTTDLAVIQAAIRTSVMVELNADGDKFRRKTPFECVSVAASLLC
jgi:hypothetical protein